MRFICFMELLLPRGEMGAEGIANVMLTNDVSMNTLGMLLYIMGIVLAEECLVISFTRTLFTANVSVINSLAMTPLGMLLLSAIRWMFSFLCRGLCRRTC
jgi:hypothetical protein